jgi:NADH dehydrogenase/putative oxidoreductase
MAASARGEGAAHQRVAPLLRLQRVIQALGSAAAPWLSLIIRIWLAKAFLLGGVMEMMAGPLLHAVPGWWPTLLHDVTGSSPGIAIQALCPVLLALGLLTRPVAAAMLLQAWFLPLPGAAADAPLFWAGLLGWLMVFGAGPISFDRLLGTGVQNSAVPGAAAAARSAAWLTRRAGPPYQLVLRLWLAAAPAGLALAKLASISAMRPGVSVFFPHIPVMVMALAPWAALALAGLLLLGLATRAASLLLLLLVPLSQLSVTGEVRLYWALLLGLYVVHGAGPYSLDGWGSQALRRVTRPRDRSTLPHVVIVGGGFGGVAAAQGLRSAPCRVTLIDRRNHQVFQPLLYQVATASLAPGDIATPIRSLFRDQANILVTLGEVVAIDVESRAVILPHVRVPYDYLVVASGAQHSYFGRNDWAPHAPGLKSIEDGIAIRRRLLLAFEEAENVLDEEEQRAWLTFVVVGGGPTGVELAGAIAELARHGLAQDFRRIDPATARIILVQSGPRLLPTFPESLSREAERALRDLGVDVQTDKRVLEVSSEQVTISGVAVRSRTVFWAAGVMASPAAGWLGVTPDRAGRVPVDPDLSVPGRDGVFAIGDTAAALAWRGEFVPGLAPAAKQAGAYVATVIRARLSGRAAPPPFRYRHFGSLATIGRQAAVADFGFVRLRGSFAWWLWGLAHIAFLVGGRNRSVVVLQWAWSYFTFRRSTLLITGDQ